MALTPRRWDVSLLLSLLLSILMYPLVDHSLAGRAIWGGCSLYPLPW